MAEPTRATFQLVRLTTGEWLLEQPIGTPRLAGRSQVPPTSRPAGGQVRPMIGAAAAPVRIGAEAGSRNRPA
ncbi:hypothetical protein [Actinoplanes sp. NPDC020271]|uniref:hypothetical protein n=1 Tax=Actinoplanes sp. NPDC020271 TaxID=3363896 RepID=UPI00379A0562